MRRKRQDKRKQNKNSFWRLIINLTPSLSEGEESGEHHLFNFQWASPNEREDESILSSA